MGKNDDNNVLNYFRMNKEIILDKNNKVAKYTDKDTI